MLQKKEKENRMNLELRMYFFVPYNISEIQKGIQAGHAALEYAYKYGQTELYQDFIKNHKTFIILNGGTTRDIINDEDDGGTLQSIQRLLGINKIEHSSFKEPDLNYATTALCFIADERVFNKEKYPDWIPGEKWINIDMHIWNYDEWINFIGGEKNLFLRELLKDKRLA